MYPGNAEIIVFYDSDCLFCNKVIIIINKLDTKKTIYFSKLTGEIGCRLRLDKYCTNTNGSMVVVDAKTNNICIASDAILKIALHIKGLYIVAGVLKLLLPRKLRDLIYYKISNNRAAISTHFECSLPTDSLLKQII